jgi:hypothetical protein
MIQAIGVSLFATRQRACGESRKLAPSMKGAIRSNPQARFRAAKRQESISGLISAGYFFSIG